MFDSPATPYLDHVDIASFPTTNLDSHHEVEISNPDSEPTLVVAAESVEALSGLHSAERSFPCSGRTQLFFAPPGERRVRREKREATARSYCDQCSVKQMCKVAGRAGREHGIWGGENDEERAAAGYPPMFPHRKAIVRAAQEAKQHPPLSA